jgi:2-alkyl-3-oxoalkanoate reductase
MQPANPLSRVGRRTGSVLVTGATGLLGRAVCAELGRRKVKFRALVRVGSDRETIAGTGAWMIEGDLTRAGSLTAALDGVDVVLHLAGLIKSKDQKALDAVHVGGTRRLWEEGSPRRIVAISSDTVGRSHRSPYADSKRAMEALLADAPCEVVTLRPPMILGPGSPHLRALERVSRLPLLPVPAGAGRRRPVHVDDVANAVLAAMDLDSSDVPDRPIDLPGAFAVPLPILIKAVARAQGRRGPRIVSVPAGALRGAAKLNELFSSDPLLSIERLEGLAEEVESDGKMARHRLGWKPRVLEEVLAGCEL